MKNNAVLVLLVTLLLLVCRAGLAAGPVYDLDSATPQATLTDFEFTADAANDISLDDILSGSVPMSSSADAGVALQPDSHNYWLRYQLRNTSDEYVTWSVGYENWGHVDFYIIEEAGAAPKHTRTGYFTPYAEREAPHYNPSITPVELGLYPGQQVQVVVKLQASTNMHAYPLSLAATVLTGDEAAARHSTLLRIVYLFAGILLGTFIYNLFVYISTRDHSYFYYLGIVACSLLFTFTNFREMPYLDQFDATHSVISLIDVAGGTMYGFFIIMFTRSFLNVRENFPILDKILVAIIIGLLLLPILVVFKQGLLAANINSLFGLLTMVMVLITAICSVWKRQPSAGYFLFAFSFFAIGIFVFLSAVLGLLPTNTFTLYAMQYGTSLEAVLFSFALGNRINLLRRENETNQQRLIEQMTENEQLQKEWTQSLEEKVEEQTRDLSRTNKELSEQNSALYSVNNLSRELSAQLTRPRIIELVGDRLQALYPESKVSMFLTDNKAESMQPVMSAANDATKTNNELQLDNLVNEVRTTGGVIKQTQAGTGASNTSSLAVPIRRGDEISGALVLHTDTDNGFNEASENLIGALGANIGTALSNASLFEETIQLNEELQAENIRISAELSVAAKIQQMILPTPQELKQISHLQLAAAMHPADEVGGDYYDILQVNDRTTVAIGDVTGHGLASGVLMMQTQIALRTLLENTEVNDARLLSRLNQSLYRNLQRMSEDRNLSLAMISHQGNNVTITGQHEDVLLVGSNGNTTLIDTIELGMPVGLEPDISEFMNTSSLALGSGEGLVLYTDGITEAENSAGDMYGVQRLQSIITAQWQQDVQSLVDAVINDVRRHIGEGPIVDDITLVILRQP